jgi:hypothetical protein
MNNIMGWLVMPGQLLKFSGKIKPEFVTLA